MSEYGIIMQFDDNQGIDPSGFEVPASTIIHTDNMEALRDDLGCENLKTIALIGEDKVPVYQYVGKDQEAFDAIVESDIGRQKFELGAGALSSDYSLAMQIANDAPANKVAGNSNYDNQDACPLLSASSQDASPPPKPFG